VQTAHREVQQIAKAVLSEMAPVITPHDTERSIAGKAVEALRARGITETWYYNCPALVLLGSRSGLSVSGRDYEPADEPVGELNVVTIDLSPSRDGIWGDCARTFLVEDGRVTEQPVSAELAKGWQFLDGLHAGMRLFVDAQMTFHELFTWASGHITMAGFENLDFGNNVGHSIVARREDRQYVKAGNRARLCDVPLFTFEPHVRQVGGRWAFKHEDIFFFNAAGQIEEL
jgi:Xaa-Pro aminopeptidase